MFHKEIEFFSCEGQFPKYLGFHHSNFQLEILAIIVFIQSVSRVYYSLNINFIFYFFFSFLKYGIILNLYRRSIATRLYIL